MGTSSQERCWGQNHREASSEGAGNWEHSQASSREAGVDASGWGFLVWHFRSRADSQEGDPAGWSGG